MPAGSKEPGCGLTASSTLATRRGPESGVSGMRTGYPLRACWPDRSVGSGGSGGPRRNPCPRSAARLVSPCGGRGSAWEPVPVHRSEGRSVPMPEASPTGGEELCQALIRGDPAVLEDLYLRYWPMLQRQARVLIPEMDY